MPISFLPNDPAAMSFLEASPLSQYVLTLRQRAQQRNDMLTESSVLVGEHSSVFGKKISESDEEDDAWNEEGASVFNSSWLQGGDSKTKKPKEIKQKKKKREMEEHNTVAVDEDVVEELVLSSDEKESASDTLSAGEDDDEKLVPPRHQSKMQKLPTNISKTKVKSRAKKSKKRKRAN